jgi:iron complex outermembrane receptor protein
MNRSASTSAAAAVRSPCVEAARRSRTPLVHALSLALAATALHAVAETPAKDDATALPEVKITAERRETKLQKTPITVNVLDDQTLARRGVAKLSDLAGLAAGVNIPSQWPNTQSVFIRGIGSSRPIGNPSVGWYLDDVYVPRSFGSSFIGSLPDIERIEVLHGPQGTLYGQNTSSGALKLITRQPTQDFNAWVSLGAGNQGQIESRGYLNGALKPDLLSGSLAVATSHLDGDVQNETLHRTVNGYGNQQLRGILKLTPENGLVATLTVDGLHGESAFSGSSSPLNYPGTGPRKNFSDYARTDQTYDSGGVSLKLEGGLTDTLSWKSVSAWRAFDVTIPSDDPYPTYLSGFDQDLEQRQLSQEFQLFGDYDRFNFITGLMLWHETFDMDRLSWSRNNFSIIDSASTTRSVGLYGQGTYHFTDALGLTVGLRLNREWRELDSAAYRSNVARERVAQTYAVEGLKRTYSAATPKVTLDYQWSPNLLTYATVAIGETAGGWNPAAATLAIAQVPVDPEKVTSYEVGFKSTTFDGRLRNNVALFYNDYENYQASINDPVINGQPVTGAVIVNAGQAHTYGAELESVFQASSGLDLHLNLAYLVARFDEFLNPTGAASTDFTGTDMPYAPRWSGSVGANYRHALESGAQLRTNLDYRVEDTSYSAVSATREFTRFPTTRYLDAGVSLTTASGAWTYSLTGKNLLNTTFQLPGSYIPALGYQSATYNRRRQLLLTVRHDFL